MLAKLEELQAQIQEFYDALIKTNKDAKGLASTEPEAPQGEVPEGPEEQQTEEAVPPQSMAGRPISPEEFMMRKK